MKTLLIGDLHLKPQQILPIVDKIIQTHNIKRVIFLGDYVDLHGQTNNIQLYAKDLTFLYDWKIEKELNMTPEDIEKFTNSDIAIPETEEHKRFIERLTKEAVIVSINRHAGGYRTYFGGKSDTLAFGKDLTAVKWIVGTGGALTRLTAREEILNSISQFNRADKLLPTAEAKILIDNDYIMASLGVLSSLNKEAAIKLLLKSLKFNENTV